MANELPAINHTKSAEESARLLRVVNVGFVGVFILMFALLAGVVERFRSLADELSHVVEINEQKLTYAFSMRDAIRERSVALHKMMSTDDLFERNDLQIKMQDFARDYRNAREGLNSLKSDNSERQLEHRLNQAVRDSQPRVRAAVDLLMQNADRSETQDMVEQGIHYMEEVLVILNELVALQRESSYAAVKRAHTTNRNVFRAVFAISILAILIGIAIARMVARYIAKHNKVITTHNEALLESSRH